MRPPLIDPLVVALRQPLTGPSVSVAVETVRIAFGIVGVEKCLCFRLSLEVAAVFVWRDRHREKRNSNKGRTSESERCPTQWGNGSPLPLWTTKSDDFAQPALQAQRMGRSAIEGGHLRSNLSDWIDMTASTLISAQSRSVLGRLGGDHVGLHQGPVVAKPVHLARADLWRDVAAGADPARGT